MWKWLGSVWSRFGEWQSGNSLYRHIAFAPVGTLGATTVLLGLSGAGWTWWSPATDLVRAGQVIPLGTFVYGTAAVFVDGGVRVIFYALAQRQKEIDRRHQEGEQRERDRWTAWNERRLEAHANGEGFDEPTPSGTTRLVTSK